MGKQVAHPKSDPGLDRWAVILAGGDGTRLRSLTRAISGDERPKQFCSIIGEQTLLEQTCTRVARAVSEDHMLLVLTESHAPFYRELISGVQFDRLLIQPHNKGTAPAIICALTRIAWKAPEAIVGIFPSDHYFSNDEVFMSYVETAFDAARTRPGTVTLLGITPESPEVEYGWIESQLPIIASLPRAISRVRRFWEKPSANLASRLMKRGCLWNSFVMVAHVDAFLRMARSALPELCDAFSVAVPAFGTPAEATKLGEVYSCIPATNFSQEVLAMRPNDLAVLRVDEVGWSDLGEPSRVLRTLAQWGSQSQWEAAVG